MRRVILRRARHRPVSERPGFFLAVERAEPTDLLQILAQAVTKALQRAAGCAVEQPVAELQQNHGAQNDLRQLPDDGENKHPQDAQSNGFAFQFLIGFAHADLLMSVTFQSICRLTAGNRGPRTGDLYSQPDRSRRSLQNPLGEMKSTSVFGSPLIKASMTWASV